MARNQKGGRTERELVNELHDREMGVLKVPASGGATDRELPDVFTGNGDIYIAIEAKSSKGDPIYIDGQEIEDLNEFADRFGADAKIGVKFNIKHGDPAYGDDANPGWYFFDPDDLYVTDGGNYRVKKEKALAEGIDINELVGHSEQTRLTDHE